MKPRPSRTINRLHFEDLDPQRFEDLVRQLIYGFREWTVLEAIGASGNDGGVDIRGVELVHRPSVGDDSEGEADELRTWFAQCKRERALGPAKATAIVRDALDAVDEPPHGLLLVAGCELSRRTRETLADEARSRGVREIVAWSRSELEDLLYLPEHDHLLFAYFGISLAVRRNNLATELRRRLATKRRIFSALGDLEDDEESEVLVRDPTFDGYPGEGLAPSEDLAHAPWIVGAYLARTAPDEVAVRIRRHHAWISPSRKQYDFVDTCSHLRGDREANPSEDDRCDRLWRYFHTEVAEAERAWLDLVGWVRYDDLILVDDLGDAYHPYPHLLTMRDKEHGLFYRTKWYLMVGSGPSEEALPLQGMRRRREFPVPVPDIPWGPWGAL